MYNVITFYLILVPRVHSCVYVKCSSMKKHTKFTTLRYVPMCIFM